MVNFELLMNGRAVAKIEIDADFLSRFLQGGASGAAQPAPAKSAPLSEAQAAELIERLDKTSRQFIARLVEEGGALTWGETKLLFEVKSWEEFAEGPLKKIDKALHRILGERTAQLVWRQEHEWIGLEKGEDEVCRLHVDGPALTALQAASKAA